MKTCLSGAPDLNGEEARSGPETTSRLPNPASQWAANGQRVTSGLPKGYQSVAKGSPSLVPDQAVAWRRVRGAMMGAVLAVVGLGAAPPRPSPIAVTQGWTRPAVAGINGAGYFTVIDRGALGDRLTGAASPAAARVSIHLSRMAAGVMTMRPLSGVDLPPRGTVSFAPGGLHLMLEGLRHPLKVGDRVPVALRFVRAGRVWAYLTVRLAPPGPAMPGMRM